ncbi:MAG: hypothetical protein QM767_25100 [Anaeromyxobacter sp.]
MPTALVIAVVVLLAASAAWVALRRRPVPTLEQWIDGMTEQESIDLTVVGFGLADGGLPEPEAAQAAFRICYDARHGATPALRQAALEKVAGAHIRVMSDPGARDRLEAHVAGLRAG